MGAVLRAKGLTMVFGGLCAVNDFSCEIEKGELVGLIGPNGAGKTTVFNMLSGIYRPTSGKLGFLNGKGREYDLTRMEPHKITQSGIARTFQNIRLFKDMTVLDNVLIARHKEVGYTPLGAIIRSPAFSKAEKKLTSEAQELLAIFGIESKQGEKASNLPYGEQRKLEIVRALATSPTLLLLDEPAAGMNPQETKNLMELIDFIRKRFSLTIMLIEHDMNLVMGICERLIVLDYGRIIAEGLPEKIRKDPIVIQAYLGTEGGM
jgi:branched-chain amino acid transport system ATP-binding protein